MGWVERLSRGTGEKRREEHFELLPGGLGKINQIWRKL